MTAAEGENKPVGDSAPQLCFGVVLHRRLRPAAHAFRYPVYFLAVPMSRVASLARPWFGLNRFNLLSFHFRDHGLRDGSNPVDWVRGLLAAEGLAAVADGEIWLQTFPRVLGYVFNPVSFWFCEDRAGRVRAIVAEVNNTFGEGHAYLLAHPDLRPITGADDLAARKVFHVSPFFPVQGGYRFRFHRSGARRVARIDYHDEQGDLLHTSISGAAEPLSRRTLARAFLGYPWMTVGVIARIHWQALKLWRKRVPFFAKPMPPLEQVSR
jgi:hypothetical protein